MTERQRKLLQIMEYCMLNGEFCDNCPNRDEDYEGCHTLHEEFFREVRRSWGAEEMNDGEESTEPADHTCECEGTAHN